MNFGLVENNFVIVLIARQSIMLAGKGNMSRFDFVYFDY